MQIQVEGFKYVAERHINDYIIVGGTFMIYHIFAEYIHLKYILMCFSFTSTGRHVRVSAI